MRHRHIDVYFRPSRTMIVTRKTIVTRDSNRVVTRVIKHKPTRSTLERIAGLCDNPCVFTQLFYDGYRVSSSKE